MANLLVWWSLKDAGRRRKATLPCRTPVIVNVAQQGSQTKAFPATVAVARYGRVFVVLIVLCSLTFFICCLKTRCHNTSRLHRIRLHSSSTNGSRYIIFTTLHFHHASTHELLPRLPFPVPTRMSCGNHTGSPAHRVVRSYFDLFSIRRQGGELADATPNPTPGVAQPSLAISFVSRSGAPSNDASTTNSQEEVHPVLPQLVSLRRSCPICCAESTEHKHRGAQLHNTGVHATIAAEREAYAAIHKARSCKRC